MSLRVKQSAARRRQMLEAAERLIRQTGGTDFSMRALASAAEVSPATPYNFFGSKEGLLFELLSRNLQIILQQGLDLRSKDPLERIIEAAENALDIILRDPVLLRPLYQILLGLTDPIHHPKFLKAAFAFYRSAVDAAFKQKLLTDEHECIALASSLMAHFIGLLDMWVHEDIDDEWFRAQLLTGFIRMVLPYARDGRHPALQQRLVPLKRMLSNRKIYPRFVGTTPAH